MDDNKTNYEPNFVMRDPEETPLAENTSYVSADTFQGGEQPKPTPQPTTPTEEGGLYRDPRENFYKRVEKEAEAASASWSGGRARAEGKHFFSKADSGDETAGSARRSRSDRRGKGNDRITMTKTVTAVLITCCMALSLLCGLGGAYIGNQLWGSPQGAQRA